MAEAGISFDLLTFNHVHPLQASDSIINKSTITSIPLVLQNVLCSWKNDPHFADAETEDQGG